MKNKQIILLLGIIALFVSCTPKIVFNESLRNNLDLKSINPEKLQYYIDRTVELKREISSNSTKINSGKVEYYKGKNIQIIAIKKLTPGVCLHSNDSTIDVAFENGSEAYLQFRKMKTNDSDFNIYQLNTFQNDDGKYFINYNGISYQLDENALEAKILIQRKIANKENINTKNLKGRKVK
jgi:hypothetical protein